MTMTHGSLFSGIGGFDLAAAWAGWENVFACEIDPFCQKVLKYHFPKSTLYENIRTTDFTIWRGRIDVLSGGFPCQPFSTAGKRKGTEDDRYLWPEMLRAIREISPRWVVGENVLGIVNWNGGMVFEQVCADLEAEGYEVQPYVLPACSVGAPHQRQRTWFVAHSSDVRGNATDTQDNGCGPRSCKGCKISKRVILSGKQERGTVRGSVDGYNSKRIAPHASRAELQRGKQYRGVEGTGEIEDKGGQPCRPICGKWEKFPTQSPVCGRDDGIPGELDGITLPSWRRESLKAYGNAVVPLVPLQIFNVINQYEYDENKR